MYHRHAVSMCLLLFVVQACGRDDAGPAADATPASGPQSGAAVSGDPPDAGPADRAAQEITADYMRDIVVEISSDAYEGRGPGSPGDEKARKYLADEMAQLGLEPGAANGGWEQTFELVGVDTKQPETWTFEGHGKSLTIKQWDQFIVASGLQSERTGVDNAEVVFVGYGIQAPEYDWDDFKGADLKGKVLVIMNNDPDWDPDLFAGQDAPLLRALGLQVRGGRAPGCGRRHHHPHDAVGGLSVAGRADVVVRGAVRVAGRRRAAHRRSRPG